MSSTCILTDCTAQFPQYGFQGKNDVRVIPHRIEFRGQVYEEGKDIRTTDLPPSARGSFYPRLLTPPVEQMQELLTNLSAHYHHIIAIISSSYLTPLFAQVEKAAAQVRGRVWVTLIDSQTTSIGLGLLVQSAAEAVAQGVAPMEVERLVRSLIPHIYMMLCTPGMSYLSRAGYLDESQAFVGEMLGMMPIFTLEEGQLSAVEKVRNSRGLVDFMQEFLLEFDELQHIAFLQSTPPSTHEARLMREHAQSCFSQTPFTELNINLPLATLFGPRSIGMVVMEK